MEETPQGALAREHAGTSDAVSLVVQSRTTQGCAAMYDNSTLRNDVLYRLPTLTELLILNRKSFLALPLYRHAK